MKSYLKKLAAFFTSLCVLISCFGTGIPVFAAADMVKASVTADSFVYEDTTAKVTVSLEGIPYGGKTVPTDVVLIIDRSGSMSGKLDAMKSAAKSFVSKVDLKTHRIGVVSYGSESVSFPLSANSSEINSFLSTISLDGTTNMNDAIDNAVTVLADKRKDAVGSIVLMTDGVADDMNLAMASAEKAKAKGYNFFTVALCDSETSVANQNLKKMATSETDHYSVFETSKLSQVYNSIADKIGNCTAKNVVITQTAGKDFTLVSGSADDNIPVPTQNGNTFTWKIPQLSKGISTISYEVAPKAGLTLGSYEHGTGTITYEDYDGNTQTITLDPQMIELKLHPPMITSVSPKLYDGKTERTVVVSGKYFTTDAKLYLDNVLTPIKSQTTNIITFTAPIHDDGKINIKVENSDGQSDTDILYVGPNPIVNDVSPNKIREGEKIKVKITGENFVGSRASITVMFNNEKMPLTSTSSNAIYVSGTQKLASGVYNITISCSNGGVVTIPNGFTVESGDPTDLIIDSVTHSQCIENNSVSVKIEGMNFEGSRSGDKVYINDIKCAVTSATKTCLYAKSPSTLPVGKYDVKVENSNGTCVKAEAFEVVPKPVPVVPEPKVTDVSPTMCYEGDELKVVIQGEDFTGSRSSNTVMFGDVKATLTSATKSTIYAKVPASVAKNPGTYTITVVNGDGQTATAPVQFVVEPKPVPQITITDITPNECIVGTSTKICITGDNFTNSRSGNTVMIGGVKATLTSATKTTLYANVPTSITNNIGSYDVVVTNSDGQTATAPVQFEVKSKPILQPTITDITPNECMQDESVKICITGDNFTNSRSGNTVTIGGVKATLTSATKTTIYAKVPASIAKVPGTYDIEVTNSDGGTVTLDSAFTVKPKEVPKIKITSVSPTTCKKGETVVIKIQGENFTGSRSSNIVMIGDDVKATLTSATKTCIYAKIPKTLEVGSYKITVYNSDGTSAVADVEFVVT